MSIRRSCQVCFSALVLAACGGDEKKPAAPEAESTDAAAQSADPDAAAVATMQCGAERCELPKRFELDQPCCLDPFAGGCGVMLGGTCQRYSKRDTRCPAVTPDGLMGEEAEMAGIIPCCAANNECGVDVGSGLGCMATSSACALFPREFIERLGSRTCDGEELELPPNCGAGLPSPEQP